MLPSEIRRTTQRRWMWIVAGYFLFIISGTALLTIYRHGGTPATPACFAGPGYTQPVPCPPMTVSTTVVDNRASLCYLGMVVGFLIAIPMSIGVSIDVARLAKMDDKVLDRAYRNG